VALNLRGLKIPRGECFALVGPTGAGKSTLLRLLAALEQPDHGQIHWAQHPWHSALPLAVRRRITLVHQQTRLLHRSVRSNIEYPLRIRRARDAPARAEALLRRVGLEPLARQSAVTLSGGQVQLVALARALVIEPEVLLLDEPTAHLDPAHVALAEQIIQNYRQAHGATVVWATHNLFQARRVADRVGLLLEGQMVEVAAVTDFFTRPTDPRTAEFVQGKMVY
jgi:tungstate transport system ATP-binding protein